MLRVKIFRLKEVLMKSCFWISSIVFAYLFLMICLKFINVESRSFAANIVDETINYDINFSKGELNTKLIKEELGIKPVNKLSIGLIDKESDIMDKEYIEKENIVNESIDYNKYIANDNIKIWDRPKSYIVNQLSSGKIQVGSTYVTNYIDKKINLAELTKVSDFIINNDTKILIVHTHTSEGYSESGLATNFRTLDDTMNVVSVGNILKQNLVAKNFMVKHSIKKHDTPSYNGSYSACLKTIEEEFKNNEYDIVLDLHRDALSSNLNYRPTVEINGESVAKLMFVVGTNDSGLSHAGWMENLKLALLIQNTANEMYPGLFRDLTLSKSRYNQHVCSGALILEVGATGNTLDEVWNSMKYFANVLEALKTKSE